VPLITFCSSAAQVLRLKKTHKKIKTRPRQILKTGKETHVCSKIFDGLMRDGEKVRERT
jgi:hypothetical protein